MALITLKNKILCTKSQLLPILSRFSGLWAPDYLQLYQPKLPLNPTINVQIKGYDFPIVEQFQSFVHKMANRMDMDVDNNYAMPPKELQIKRYKPKSQILESEYKLYIYERHVPIKNVTSCNLPIFIRILEASLPVGVTLSVENYDPAKEERRYIPDTELISLKNELEESDKKN